MIVSDAPPLAGPGHNMMTTTDLLRDRFADLLAEAEAVAERANDARDALMEGQVSTDEERDPLIKIGVDAGKLAKRIGDTRLATTKPLRDEVTETNGFFDAMETRMKNVKAAFERLVGAYDQKKRDEERRRLAEEARIAAEEANRKLLEAAAAKPHSIQGDVVLREAEEAEHRAQHLAGQALGAGNGPTRTDVGTVSQRKSWTFRITDTAKIDLNELRPFFGIAEIEKALRGYVKAHRDTRPLAGVEIYPDTKAQFRG
jgi:hypothetical protein